MVGHASYAGAGDGRAEVAFAVADAMQGKGLATILLAHLADAAAEGGIRLFEAEVLPGNHRMVEVFRESGFPVETSSAPGSIHLEFPTSLSPEAQERFEGRDRIAAAAAVGRFLRPSAVAVIGASRSRGTVGGEIFHNLLEAGFEGVVYPVNPAADVVQSVRAYRTITDVPGEVDLAVIAVPSARSRRRRPRVRRQVASRPWSSSRRDSPRWGRRDRCASTSSSRSAGTRGCG